jgi:threonine synthase
LSKRKNTSPVSPANLERLESFFGNNAMMIRNFIFPSEVSEKQREKAAKELYIKYGIFADPETARAYACIKDRGNEIFDEAGSVVLTAYNHPALSADYCRHIIGESPKIPQNIQESLKGYELNRPYATTSDDLKKIIQDL